MSNGIYTEEEQQLLDKSISYRLRMVEEQFKDGTPTRTNEIRVVNEVLNSIDTAISNAANTRLKQSEVENQGKIKETVAEILKQQAEKRKLQIDRPIDVEVVLDDVTLVKPDFVPDETSTEHKEIELKDIMGE